MGETYQWGGGNSRYDLYMGSFRELDKFLFIAAIYCFNSNIPDVGHGPGKQAGPSPTLPDGAPRGFSMDFRPG